MSEHIRTPSPFRRRSDRRSILRTLPLTPIGDIASGGMSESTTTTETLTWETETDWDNNVSESGTYHPNDVVQLRQYLEGFENGLGEWVNESGNWSTNTTYVAVGSQSAGESQANDVKDIARVEPNILSGGYQPDLLRVFASESDTDSSGGGFRFLNSNGNAEFEALCEGSNDWAYKQSGGSWSAIKSENYGTFIEWDIDIDWSTGDYTVTANGNSETDTLQNVTDIARIDVENAGNTGDEFDANNGHYHYYDDVFAGFTTGKLTTGTKTFSSSSTPDLQNLDYSLNGESTTLDIIGSPGTTDEEVVSQTLDGATSYSLTWSDSHTDFRIRPDMSTSVYTATPTFSRGELVA